MYTSEAASKLKCGRTKSARIKKTKVSNFSEMEFTSPRMQTMDRRVSSSSDQIDDLRRQKIRAKSLRRQSSSRLDYQQKTEDSDGSKDGDFVTAKIHRKCDLRSNSFHQSNARTGEGFTKTPFALFLEDDGPYSRKLFGPLAHRDTEKACGRRQKENPGYWGEFEKEKVRILSKYVSIIGSKPLIVLEGLLLFWGNKKGKTLEAKRETVLQVKSDNKS